MPQNRLQPFGLRGWTASAALRRLPMEEPLAHPDIYVVPRKGLVPSRVAPLVPETRRARGTRALSLSGAARQWLYAQVNLAELAGAACE